MTEYSKMCPKNNCWIRYKQAFPTLQYRCGTATDTSAQPDRGPQTVKSAITNIGRTMGLRLKNRFLDAFQYALRK